MLLLIRLFRSSAYFVLLFFKSSSNTCHHWLQHEPELHRARGALADVTQNPRQEVVHCRCVTGKGHANPARSAGTASPVEAEH